MKNIQSKEKFLLIKEQQLNEGLFSFLKNAWANVSKLFNKFKGGKELEKLVDDYKKSFDNIFIGLTSAEQNKSAADKNIKSKIESMVYEVNADGSGDEKENTAQNTGQELQPSAQTQDAQNTQNAQNAQDTNLNQTADALKGKINRSKEQIKIKQKEFNGKIQMLQKKHIKDGEVPKKLKIASELAKNQISDYIWEKWEEHYTQIGDKKIQKEIQNKRMQLAKKMQKETKLFKQQFEGGDEEKRTFEIDKKYSYTNSEGKEIEITIKKVGDDGSVKSAELVNGAGETVTINPYTDKIGKKVEEEPKEGETQAQPKTQTQKV